MLCGCRIMVVQRSPKPFAGVRFPPPVHKIKTAKALAVFILCTDFILKFGQNLKKCFKPAFKSAPCLADRRAPTLLKARILLRAKPGFKKLLPLCNGTGAEPVKNTGSNFIIKRASEIKNSFFYFRASVDYIY